MADMASSKPDPKYKAILVKNETSNATVSLFLYARYDPICGLPFKSETIEPGKDYFFRDKKKYKYQLKLQQKETSKEKKENKRTTILNVTEWTKDKLLFVKENEVAEEDLLNYPDEHQICTRRKNLEDETSAELGRDLYGILKLDMKEVRKHPIEKQDSILKKAYYKQMLLFHPDRNPDQPDDHICQEIIMAYSILGDHEKRAQYHDITDYSGGWLSRSRWKAIFKPQAHGEWEKFKRIGLLVFSTFCVAGGLALTVLTAGLGFPAFIGFNMLAGAFIGGGIQSGFRTVGYDSIKNGVTWKNYGKSFAVGAVLGAAAGGVSAGITASLISIESTAAAVVEASVGEIIGNGAATGAINGAAASVSSVVDKVWVDGQVMCLAEIVRDVCAGAILGSVIGVGGAIGGKMVSKIKIFKKVNGELVEAGEQIVESIEGVGDVLNSFYVIPDEKSDLEEQAKGKKYG